MSASLRAQRQVAERRARALQLRADGATYAQIAEALGHKSPSNAVQDVTRALTAAAKDQGAIAGLHVALELERLDAAERAATLIRDRAVDEGDEDTALRAIDRSLRIADRRARLLGLPAAQAGVPSDESGESVVDQLAARRTARRNRFSAPG